jgi:hypothetical protein
VGVESRCNEDRSNEELNVLAHAVYFSVGPEHSVEFGIALTPQQQVILTSDEARSV